MRRPTSTGANASRTRLLVAGLLCAGCSKGSKGAESDASAQTKPSSPEAAGAPRSTNENPGEVTGVVRGPAGPIEGARVCASKRGARIRATRTDVQETVCATTVAGGTFSLTLDPDLYLAGVGAEGMLGHPLALAVSGQRSPPPLDVTLEAGGTLVKGRVYDMDGKPVAGAKVFSSTRLAMGPMVPTSQTRTDANGRYRLWISDGPDAQPRAWHASLVSAFRREGPEGTELGLYPGSVVRGRVVDTEGKPVPGARVAVSDGMGNPTGFAGTAVLADGDGKFELDGLAPGRYKLVGLGDDRGGTSAQRVRLRYAETVEGIVVTLDKAFESLRGRLVDEEGAGVGGCLVRAGRGMGSFAWSLEDGQFEFLAREKTKPLMGISCSGRVGAPPYPPVAPVPAGDPLPEFRVMGGRVLRGKVVDREGKPIVGIQPSLEYREEFPAGGYEEDAPRKRELMEPEVGISDANGNVEIRGLFPGKYAVRLRGQYEDRDELVVEVEDAPVTEASIVLDRNAMSLGAEKRRSKGSTAEVLVEDVDGNPVPNALVYVDVLAEKPDEHLDLTLAFPDRFAVTNDHGVATIRRGVVRNRHAIYAARPGLLARGTISAREMMMATLTLQPVSSESPSNSP